MRLNSSSSVSHSIKALLLGGLFLFLQGCGLIYKTTGDVLVHYGQDKMVPYMMSMQDTDMACALGEAMTPFLLSFETVGADPDKLAVLQYVSAASCAEQKALEAELRYMRMINQGRPVAAQDARIVQKRMAALAARRQYEAYKRMISEYGKIKPGQCPELEGTFNQLVYMIGLIAGIQALANDATSGGQVGVPRNIAAKVVQGSYCLENSKWWGVPKGLRGAIWTILPPLAPKNAHPWQMLEKAEEMGFEQGVRLGSALYAMAAYSKGATKRLKGVIRRFADYNTSKLDEDYRLLDAMAYNIILGLSDRLWTRATGTRTPIGELGTFWNDEPEQKLQNINIKSLL